MTTGAVQGTDAQSVNPIIVTKTIGRVTVTWDGSTFTYDIPMGMSAKVLTNWKTRNAKALKEMKDSTSVYKAIKSLKDKGDELAIVYRGEDYTVDVFFTHKGVPSLAIEKDDADISGCMNISRVTKKYITLYVYTMMTRCDYKMAISEVTLKSAAL